MKMLKFSLLIIVLLIVAYYLFKPSFKTLNPLIASDGRSIEMLVDSLERDNLEVNLLKEGNGHQFEWYAQKYEKTSQVLLYLHGFSATPEEGNPVHINIAKRFGMNFYAPRLMEHGLVSEHPMLNLTPEGYLESVKEAYQVAEKMGNEVIIMASSTGCTLGLYLAAHNPDFAKALILYSPNIEMKNQSAKILTQPLGLQLGRVVTGSDFKESTLLEAEKGIWYGKYRLEAVRALQSLLEKTMKKETFEKVKCPVFVGYYYKNEKDQDQTVSVEAIREMYANLSTPISKKEIQAFPEAGAHVIGSSITSKAYKEVEVKTVNFIENKLGIVPVTRLEN